MDFQLARLEKTLADLCAAERAFPVETRYISPDPGDFRPEMMAAADGYDWVPFAAHERWGARFQTALFRVPVALPRSLDGKSVALRVRTGREGGWTAFNPQFFACVDGQLIQGLDVNHTEVRLTDHARGQRYDVLLHAFAGTVDGLMELTTELVALDDVRASFISAFRTALDAASVADDDRGERTELMAALDEVANALNFRDPEALQASLPGVATLLDERVYRRQWPQSLVRVHAIGHTHIDVAWQWTVSQTRQKAQRSFATALELMERYPQYRFFSSQPILFDFIRQDNPELYGRIQARAREGRFELEGGMWLEPDCNLPAGESLVRQILLGKAFLKREFGVDSEILWLPDSFGYTAALPQLMRLSGLKYFLSSKLSWNEYNRIPADTFWWEGMDGSRVLAHMITTPDDTGLPNAPDFSTYNATLQPKNVLGAWRRFASKAVTRDIPMTYGFGDGGGGPTREMLESGANMAKGLPALPQLRFSSAGEFFTALRRNVQSAPHVPVWRGELYFEYHRGTYTSIADNKRLNRLSELALRDAELVAALRWRDTGEYPAEALETDWKLLCLNAFHDLLPGSAVAEVYEQSAREHRQIQDGSLERIRRALSSDQAGQVRRLALVNPLWFEQDTVGMIRLATGCGVSLDGKPLTCQALPDGRTAVALPKLPPLGWTVLDVEPGETEAVSNAVATDCLENSFFRLSFDAQGALTSIYDKRADREVLKPGTRGNVLEAFEDRPAACDAWNIDRAYELKGREVRGETIVERWESGPVCSSIRVRTVWGRTGITQIIRIFERVPRIDFETEIDWRESQMLLKALFPVDIRADRATCGTQFGNVERPVTRNTSYDEARFEICFHRYFDLSEPDYGVSLLASDKYGADVLDGHLRLTLLKAPEDPFPGGDHGTHRFTYSLYPHGGDWRDAHVAEMAAAVERPVAIGLDGALVAQSQASLLALNCRNIAVESVKRSEDGTATIVRLYEYEGARAVARLRFDRAPAKVWITDLLETNRASVPVDGNAATLSFAPYEIKTIRVCW